MHFIGILLAFILVYIHFQFNICLSINLEDLAKNLSISHCIYHVLFIYIYTKIVGYIYIIYINELFPLVITPYPSLHLICVLRSFVAPMILVSTPLSAKDNYLAQESCHLSLNFS